MDHVGCLSLGDSHTFCNTYHLNARKTISAQPGPFFVVASFSWFSSKDSHEFCLKRNEFSQILCNLWLFPQELYTFSKLSLVCIKVAAANFITSSLFAQELHTFSKISQVSLKMNFIKLEYNIPNHLASSNHGPYRSPGSRRPAWRASSGAGRDTYNGSPAGPGAPQERSAHYCHWWCLLMPPTQRIRTSDRSWQLNVC